MSFKEKYKKLKENPTLKKAKSEFIKNIGEIKRRENPIKYKESKFEKKLSSIKSGIDIGFGYKEQLNKTSKPKKRKKTKKIIEKRKRRVKK